MRLTIQLPVEELGRISQLLEQVRQLMADSSGGCRGQPEGNGRERFF